VTAQSLVSDTGAGVAQVGNLGVSVALSGPAQVNGSGAWEVTATNHGGVADTYALTAFGPFAPYAQITPASVTLAPGASQTVQLTASGFGAFLATDYLLGIHAQSQAQSSIQDEDMLMVAILPVEGATVDLQPSEQTINGTVLGVFTLVVTNTGNVETTFDLGRSAPSGVIVKMSAYSLTLPPFASAVMMVAVNVPGNGAYPFTVTATSGAAQGSDTATLVVEGVIPPQVKLYLPMIYQSEE
jgi:hypothetical protein